MEEIRALFFGIIGGVLGSFFKFWIQDLRDWQKGKLSKREILLLRIMKTSPSGAAEFIWQPDGPPTLDWAFKGDLLFEDRGETDSLVLKGLAFRSTLNSSTIVLTPKGWEKSRGMPEWTPSE